jgi:hypothetical protein
MPSEPASADNPAELSRMTRWRPLLLGMLLIALVGFVELWIVSAGEFGKFPEQGGRYQMLAQGFLQNRLSLLVPPPPELLALADPYDPDSNADFRMHGSHDLVLFEGRYYLYWGPVPALLLALFGWVVGPRSPRVQDWQLVYLFLIAAVTMTTILIFQARRRFFPNLPLTASIPFVLSVGFGTPALFTLARPAIYEAAICAGQFFLMAGLVAAWFGFSSGRPRTGFLLLASCCWALSFGSRVSLGPAAMMLNLLAIAQVWRMRAQGRTVFAAAALAIPAATGALLLGWYNYARFRSFTEFGLLYQLSGLNQHAMHMSQFSNAWYMPLNLLRYLMAPPVVQRSFPFVRARSGMPNLAAWLKTPAGYNFEPLVGLFWCQSLLLLAPVAVAAFWRRKYAQVSRAIPDRPLLLWLTLSLALAAMLGFAPALTIAGATMRYLLDMVPCCTVLAALGYWWTLSRLSARRSQIFRAAAIAVLAAECVMGLLLGMQGYYSNFDTFNPDLYGAIRSLFGAP